MAQIPGGVRGRQHPPDLCRAPTPTPPPPPCCPELQGCLTGSGEKTGDASRRTKWKASPTALAACKRWAVAVCRSKFKEGSQAPHCTSHLLWLGHPWSSGRHQNMLLLAALGKLPLWQLQGPLGSHAASSTDLVFTLFSLQKIIQAPYQLTPPTAIQHRLLQRNETCRTRLLLSHLLSGSTATPPAYAEVKWPSQRFSPLRDPDLLQRGPYGCSDLAPAHGPRGGGNLPQRQNAVSLGSPFLLRIPPHRAPQLQAPPQHCKRGTAAATQVDKHSQQQQLREPHFYQLELAQNLSPRAEHLSCTFPPSMLLSAGGTKPKNRVRQ